MDLIYNYSHTNEDTKLEKDSMQPWAEGWAGTLTLDDAAAKMDSLSDGRRALLTDCFRRGFWTGWTNCQDLRPFNLIYLPPNAFYVCWLRSACFLWKFFRRVQIPYAPYPQWETQTILSINMVLDYQRKDLIKLRRNTNVMQNITRIFMGI